MLESPDMHLTTSSTSPTPFSGQPPSLVSVVSKHLDGIVVDQDKSVSSHKQSSNLNSRFITDKYPKDNTFVDQDSNSSLSEPEDLPPPYDEVFEADTMVHSIASCIERELKQAKSTSLGCGEVLVPCNLTVQVAQDVVNMSETEPCGLRGCILYINLAEEESRELRRIGSIKVGGRHTVPTFEMYLNLKRANGGWFNLVSSKLFRNFNRNSIVISDGYQLSKKKLYRSESLCA